MESIKIDKTLLLSLVSEASQVTAMTALWTGNLPTGDKSDVALTKYYFKWIDVTKAAVENLSDSTPDDVKSLIAEDLVRLISVPLRGMMESVTIYAKQLTIALPPINSEEIPHEIFAYKKWSMDYISKAMNIIKEVKK
jgi:hypothetical protein